MIAASAIALSLAALLPSSGASAATRSGADGNVGLTLDGRTLTATVRPSGFTRAPASEQVRGRRLQAICGTTFREPDTGRPPRRVYVRATVRWPAGADSVAVRFRRDVSARARWCLLEAEEGEDIAFVSFVRAEPVRRLASGRGAGGTAWRLVAWRGERLQPCGRLIDAGDWFGRCFDDQAEREVRLDVDIAVGACGSDGYLWGVAPRTAVRVEAVLDDGTRIGADTIAPVRGSRMRADWFVIPLSTAAAVEAVEAFDAEGAAAGVVRLPGAVLCD